LIVLPRATHSSYKQITGRRRATRQKETQTQHSQAAIFHIQQCKTIDLPESGAQGQPDKIKTTERYLQQRRRRSPPGAINDNARAHTTVDFALFVMDSLETRKSAEKSNNHLGFEVAERSQSQREVCW
jgi:hypothetical protein